MMESTHNKLLAAVEKFLSATKMAPTTFGREAVNDVNLVAQLREGRDVRSSTQDKILSFIGSRSNKAPDVSCLSQPSDDGVNHFQGAGRAQVRT